MAYIKIDIDIEDYLDEVETKHLQAELMRRKRTLAIDDDWTDLQPVTDPGELKQVLLHLLDLRAWHGKTRILQTIDEILI